MAVVAQTLETHKTREHSIEMMPFFSATWRKDTQRKPPTSGGLLKLGAGHYCFFVSISNIEHFIKLKSCLSILFLKSRHHICMVCSYSY